MLFEQIEKELEISKRHLIVLKAVMKKGPIGILKLAEETNMPAYKVRYSLRILEQKQLIKPSIQGAIVGSEISNFIYYFEADCQKLQNMLDIIIKEGNSL